MPEIPQSLIELKEITISTFKGNRIPPLELSINKGEGLVFIHDHTDVLQELLRVAMGWEEPITGEIFFIGKNLRHMSYLENYSHNLKIGLVHRAAVLISNRSIFDNIMLHYLYSRSESKKLLKEKARLVIDSLKLSDYAYDRPAQELPEDKRRLGLYALAMAKDPLLYILERPAQFLDADFAKVWELLTEKKKNGAGIFVLARPMEQFAAGSFEKVIAPQAE
ncbi:MAG: hypothetical protein LBE38_10390 [Deltaproteobacteria bacterium]|jgi:putative ABC transport system ATP-binding protein|nr:hypothetical protein [Deltaproteobacteria bacterium]